MFIEAPITVAAWNLEGGKAGSCRLPVPAFLPSKFIPAANLFPMETKEFVAIRRFDEENARDPKQYELPYSIWLSDWVSWLTPAPSEALRLAARCQHLCRWEI